MQTLLDTKWLDLATLTTVGHDSPYYNERSKAGIFYAESWLMMHMLLLGQDYRPKYGDFSKAILAGQPAAAALEAVYGKSLAQVEKDLHAYLRSTSLKGASSSTPSWKRPIWHRDCRGCASRGGTDAGRLLVTLNNRHKEAAEVLAKLSQEHPDRPEVEESLGYLAWYSRDRESAQAHFEKAVTLGTKNARSAICWPGCRAKSHCSQGGRQAPWKRALQLQPHYRDAQLTLGTRRCGRSNTRWRCGRSMRSM